MAGLWGSPQVQTVPAFVAEWDVTRVESRTEVVAGKAVSIPVQVTATEQAVQNPASTAVTARLHLDPRRKGLIWYALYDVDFAGEWTYVHTLPQAKRLRITHAFPVAAGLYDSFRFEVDGKDRARELVPRDGPGLDPALADRVFDPFVTGAHARGGTGLGLSIVRALAQAHGGCAEVTGPGLDGRGVRFRVSLPTSSGAAV